MTNTKQILRKQFLAKRLSLSKTEVGTASSVIAKRLQGLKEAKTASVVLVYLAVNNEVETRSLVNWLFASKKTVVMPVFNSASKSYICAEFSGWGNLAEGPYGILEPARVSAVDPRFLDLAILPGVAFDLKGARLGYGKGVFDKLLRGTNCKKIGLAYDFQIVEDLPREKHDLVMDVVVTEKRVLKISKVQP